jgi:hypothetical protein
MSERLGRITPEMDEQEARPDHRFADRLPSPTWPKPSAFVLSPTGSTMRFYHRDEGRIPWDGQERLDRVGS